MIKEERLCIFCGKSLDDQKKNFEHIIPKWLVAEADLARRPISVKTSDGQIKFGMGRIGTKVCKKCNDEGSDLEGRTRQAYLSIKEGRNLKLDEVRSIMDWLDKVRIGMWLWFIMHNKGRISANPKFRINDRVAKKDRIMIAIKYPEKENFKGLSFSGCDEYFFNMPCCIGLLINNIALISISGDFILLKHQYNLIYKHVVLPDDTRDAYELTQTTVKQPRLSIHGGPTIYGQCIIPEDSISEFDNLRWTPSKLHKGHSESPILSLNSSLEGSLFEDKPVNMFDGNIGANMALMELNAVRAARFLAGDNVNVDVSRLEPSAQKIIKNDINSAKTDIDIAIVDLEDRYFRAVRFY